jgi:hypothetical protein
MPALEIDAAELGGIEAAVADGGERLGQRRRVDRPGMQRKAPEFAGHGPPNL